MQALAQAYGVRLHEHGQPAKGDDGVQHDPLQPAGELRGGERAAARHFQRAADQHARQGRAEQRAQRRGQAGGKKAGCERPEEQHHGAHAQHARRGVGHGPEQRVGEHRRLALPESRRLCAQVAHPPRLPAQAAPGPHRQQQRRGIVRNEKVQCRLRLCQQIGADRADKEHRPAHAGAAHHGGRVGGVQLAPRMQVGAQPRPQRISAQRGA